MTSPQPSESVPPVNRHALTAVERQRAQLEKLLKDPTKPAYVPPAPKEKTIRPAREMMKNVQGSSAGAGSGEFHVYKASRRREYERLSLLEEAARKEAEVAEFERKRKEAEAIADAKTAKNRAKRQKKKERAKTKGSQSGSTADSIPRTDGRDDSDVPLKKRRLVNGKELVFRPQGGDESEDDEGPQPELQNVSDAGSADTPGTVPNTSDISQLPVAPPKVTIHEDD